MFSPIFNLDLAIFLSILGNLREILRFKN